jgi:hypothetical protein
VRAAGYAAADHAAWIQEHFAAASKDSYVEYLTKSTLVAIAIPEAHTLFTHTYYRSCPMYTGTLI